VSGEEGAAKPGKKKGARANREGKPWKRADGRHCMRLYPPDGTIEKRPAYVYGKSRAEVMRKHAEKKAEQARGITGGDVSIGDYMTRWLDVTLPQYVRAGELAETTADSYRDLALHHIIPDKSPTLARVGLRELSAPMVREWQDGLLRKPSGRRRSRLRPGEAELPGPPTLSPRTVAYCRAILHKAIADALRDEVGGLQRNVVDLTDPPKSRRKAAAVTITPEQAGRLLVEMSRDSLWCYWLVAFTLGLRRGEGLGMRWGDIDLTDRTWQPSMQVQRIRGEADPETGRRKGRLVLTGLKTEASGLKVALPRSASDALAKWRPEQARAKLAAARWADLDLVFTTRLGTAIEPRNVNRAWARLCERAEVEGVRLHDLRHACASYLLAAGVNSKVVQRTLRHSRLATTELYLHALEEVPREAAEAMDGIVAALRERGAL
jgi:integrase